MRGVFQQPVRGPGGSDRYGTQDFPERSVPSVLTQDAQGGPLPFNFMVYHKLCAITEFGIGGALGIVPPDPGLYAPCSAGLEYTGRP
jgi:hypothetical protein